MRAGWRGLGDQVTYDIDGLCEANRDTLYKDLIVLMQSTSRCVCLCVPSQRVGWSCTHRSLADDGVCTCAHPGPASRL